MCRAAVRRALLAALLALGAGLAPERAEAATPAPVSAPAGFEMTRSVQQALKRLQELWLQWLGASLQDNPAKAGETLRSLQATARQLGFVRLPDLALGASARALQSTAEGDITRARRELEAAEALDPGRPDIAFTAATVARAQGAWGRALGSSFEGFRRLASAEHRQPLVVRFELWLLLTLMLGAALFVFVQAMMKGSGVYGDLERWLAARMPSPIAHAAAIVLLLGPLALPGGPVWLVLVWSVLLWGYGTRSERAVFFLVWATLAGAPLAAGAIERDLALFRSPPMRALEQFEDGRLGGTLFADVQVLRTALPEDPAVLEVIADLHRTLGQWELARPLYRQVVGSEGDVSTALLNLGADAFRKGDFAAANDYSQRAASSEPPSAAAWYNLSLSYSESYQFDESRRALDRAREIDGSQVDRWIQTPNQDRVLTFNGGLARRRQIALRLREAWTAVDEDGATSRGVLQRWQPAVAAGIAALAALILHLLRRGGGYSDSASWLSWRSSAVARWSRAFLPALSHVELGEGFAAAANLLLLAALFSLPRLATLAGDFSSTGAVRALSLGIAIVGAIAYLALRVRFELGSGGA